MGLFKPTRKRPAVYKPPKNESIDYKKALDDASQQSRNLLFFFLSYLTYVLITTSGTSDEKVIKNKEVPLPIFDIDIPVNDFFVFAPFLIVVFHLHLLINLREHAQKLGPFKENDLYLYPFLFNISHKYFSVKAITWILVYSLPLLTLLFVQIRYIPLHRNDVTYLHQGLVLLDLIFLSVFWFVVRDPQFKILKSKAPIGFHLAVSFTVIYLTFFGAFAIFPGLNLSGRDLRESDFQRLDLRSANFDDTILENVDFSSANLNGASFIRSKMQGANLRNAELQGADLAWAELQRANLAEAKLQGANLAEANLQGANLAEANLQGANLAEAKLRGVELFDAELQGANLTGAELQGANLTGADLRGANLMEAELRKANFTGADLRGANLSYAELQEANLTGAELREANLTGAELREANLLMAKLQEANLTRAELWGAVLEFAKLQGANLSYAELQEANLTGAKLQGANLARAKLQGANLARAKLQGANLTGAELWGAVLEFAELQGANLTRANLQWANLARAKLQGANLTRANLQWANLTRAKLQGANLSETKLQGAFLEFAELQGANLIHTELQGASIIGAKSQGAYLEGTYLRGISTRDWDINGAVFDDPNTIEAGDEWEEIKKNAEQLPEETKEYYLTRINEAEERATDSKWKPPHFPNIEESYGIFSKTRTKLVCEDSYVAQSLIWQEIRVFGFAEKEWYKLDLKTHVLKNCPKIADEIRKRGKGYLFEETAPGN